MGRGKNIYKNTGREAIWVENHWSKINLNISISRFSVPTKPGESDKAAIVEQHLKIFKEQVEAAQEFNPTLINSHSCKVSHGNIH